ncbi:AEC family transporter [Halanaerocella petrolearia]
MKIFLFILFNNIAPIFLIISLGYLLSKKFNLDIDSLSKLNFYVFVPALTLVKIYETEIDTDLLKVILYAVIFLGVLMAVSSFIARLKGYSMSQTNAVKNSVMFYNSGNFALPLITLVFADSSHSSYAVSIQIMVLLVQSLFTNTLGFYNAGRGQMHYKETIKKILCMPPAYAILVAVILKSIPYDFTQFFLWPAVNYMKNGLVPVALLALGVQLSLTKYDFKNLDVYLTTLVRLIGGPILAYLLILVLGIDGVMAQVLLISSSVPSAVSTALIAVEFDNEPDFASQVVLTTTLLSAFTLTGVIFISQHIF